MAHPYTTIERVKRFCAGKGERLVNLLDRNLDGIADDDGTVSVFNDAINRGANKIDRALAGRYEVPFATASAVTPHYAPTYPSVADLCDIYALGQLLARLDPSDVESKLLLDEFYDELEAIREGRSSIPGATEIDAGDAAQPWAWEGKGTTAAGATGSSGSPNDAYVEGSIDDQTTGM